MSGAPPYNPQSPTQQSRYPVYSPPNKNRPFYSNNDQYQQHPPHTPPAYPSQPAAMSRSPHHPHAQSPLPGTLPPLNGAAPPPHHPDASSQFQPHAAAGTPQYSLPRPYSGSVLSSNGTTPYGHSTASHAHPSARPDGPPHLSPKKEMEPSFSMGSHGVPGYPPSAMREPRLASPPKEVVCDLNKSLRAASVKGECIANVVLSRIRNPREPQIPCPSRVSCPARPKTGLPLGSRLLPKSLQRPWPRPPPALRDRVPLSQSLPGLRLFRRSRNQLPSRLCRGWRRSPAPRNAVGMWTRNPRWASYLFLPQMASWIPPRPRSNPERLHGKLCRNERRNTSTG